MRITERKRKYRARKTAEKIDGRENAALSDASESAADDVAPENDSLVQASKKSRQVLVGLLQRKKANKEKNNSINSLMVEHREMEKEMHNMDESILEAWNEIEDLSLALKKSEAEVAGLKGALKENDLWLQNTFKYILKPKEASKLHIRLRFVPMNFQRAQRFTNWKIVTPKDILNFVIPGHLAKMDCLIFPGWYFDFGRQAGTYVVFGECLDLQNICLTAPTFKKVLLWSWDKFHKFRWPSNIGLDISDIFLNSDT